MTAYEYLSKHVVSVLKPSHVTGVGYFAVRDIKKGEVIFQPWYGESGVHSITQDELFMLPEELQRSIYETFDNKIYFLDLYHNQLNKLNKPIKALKLVNGRDYTEYSKTLTDDNDINYFINVIKVIESQKVIEVKEMPGY